MSSTHTGKGRFSVSPVPSPPEKSRPSESPFRNSSKGQISVEDGNTPQAKGLHQNDWQAILSAFSALTQSFASNAPVEHQDDLYLTCERWLFCLKAVRQLIISGFQSDAKSMQEVRPVKEVCPVLLNAIQLFLPYYSSFLERHHKFCDFTKRLCTKLVKVLVSVQGRHPYSFGDECVLRPVMDFCLARITNPEQEIESFEQFQIQCMIMVKTILECKEYKPSLIGRVINENGVSREEMKKVAVCDVLASLLPGQIGATQDLNFFKMIKETLTLMVANSLTEQDQEVSSGTTMALLYYVTLPKGVRTVIIQELIAIVNGLKICRQEGNNKVKVATYSKHTAQIINKKEGTPWEVENKVLEIWELMQ
ncbi:hypothetical protein IFM89_026227 [Coptis chinensis]|uniref:Uncharacterized protein n=1 Tax=Coptis chinensis TaxID=261450 RepID=A0A835M9L8_9MAGN|nr:hypothetical protein IFM89_026227 [Coptis chinensis]